MDADPGLPLAREAELALRAAKLVPSFEGAHYALRPGQRTPGWIIHILDDATVRVTWFAENNYAYRQKRLVASVAALTAAGLRVTEHHDDKGRIEHLVVTRAARKAAP